MPTWKSAWLVLMVLYCSLPSDAWAQNGATYEIWTGATISSPQDLANNPDLLGNGNVSALAQLEAPLNRAGNFVARVVAQITPPATGNYTFWVASNQKAMLWLTSDMNFAGKTPIAKMMQAIPPTSRQWTRYAEQKSVPISLVAGQRYYLLGIYTDPGDGVNHFSVRWQKPDLVYEGPIPAIRIIPWNYATRVALTANPMLVNGGQATTLSWSPRNATSCTASASPPNANWSGAKNISGGTQAIVPSANTMFSISCYGLNGSDASYAQVDIQSGITMSFSATSGGVGLGEPVTLTWGCQNATNASASASPLTSSWSGAKSLSGTELVVPLGSTNNFDLTCSNPYGSLTRQVSVMVTGFGGIINPGMVEFDPSLDHDAVLEGGLFAVTEYTFGYYFIGASAPVSTISMGKPSPQGDGKIRYDISSILLAAPIGTFEAKVAAVGPTGTGVSLPSNSFSVVR